MSSTYDTLNRTLTISENGRTSGYGYDLNGNIVRKYQPNGDTVSTTFDALNRQADIIGPNGADNQPLYRYTNEYDIYGNLARLSETYPSSGSQLEARTLLMVYDAANRLTAERQTNTGGDIIETLYAYDAANNRASLSASITPVNGSTSIERAHLYSYNGLNQLTEYTDSISAATTTYSYDANGSRILKSCAGVEETYTYDAENRLIALTQEGATPAQDKTYAYTYDYRTRRVLRDESSAGGTVSHVVFSGGTSQREYVGNLTATASPAVEFVRGSDYGGGIGGILYSLRGNGQNATLGVKHYNARGDVTAETNNAGSLTYQAAYEAFGQHNGEVVGTQEWGSSADRQRANTKDEDPTGLLNEGFRYRDLDTGTFITRDPAGFVDGPNQYTYVVQNPWTKFDPKGLWGYMDNPLSMAIASPINAAIEVYYALTTAKKIEKYGGTIGGNQSRVANAKATLPALAELAVSVPGTSANPGPVIALAQSHAGIATKVAKNFAKESGLSTSAKFAQKTFGSKFSSDGIEKYSKMFKMEIKTIDDMASGIKKGKIDYKKIEVGYIVKDGKQIIANTRTATALEKAGIPRSKWNAIDQTKNPKAVERVNTQLARNKTEGGFSKIRESKKPNDHKKQ